MLEKYTRSNHANKSAKSSAAMDEDAWEAAKFGEDSGRRDIVAREIEW